MHVKAKKMALGGLFLALTIICMVLGSVIETSTLFLLAAASFFVGIVIREAGQKTGVAFYLAAVLLGFMVAPNKFYVISFAAMGLYILLIEMAYSRIGRMDGRFHRKGLFWVVKYIIFNLMYIPILVIFQELLFGKALSGIMLAAAAVAGQIGLWIYDRAYEYFQVHFWNKMRGNLL